jgi:antitoxin component YwqK of YwqJK toxin-antitoxin module
MNFLFLRKSKSLQMKKLFTLSLLFIAVSSFGQRTEGNQENGEFLKYNALDKLLEKYTYKDGKKHGLYEKYSGNKTDNKVTTRGYYSEGEKDSVWTTFRFGTDQPQRVTTYKNGKKHGPEKSYSHDGTIKTEFNYANDQFHGLNRSYHPNGNIKNEYNYENGTTVGIQRSYYESGELLSVTHPYKDDLYEWTWYYENGNPKFIKTIRGRNTVVGLLRTFHENGLLHTQEEFVEGKRNGLSMAYDEFGNKTREGMYENQKKVGEWKYYTEGVFEFSKDHSAED